MDSEKAFKYQVDDKGYMQKTNIKYISIATYNVLFWPRNCLARWAIKPQHRFRYQIEKLIPDVSPDILWLQEWTVEYLHLLKLSRLAETYHISTYETTRSHTHFPLVISKIPFSELLIRDRTLFALFEWNDTHFIVIWAHLNVLGKNK